jgi:iron complex outermembrane receptor protein
MYLLFFCGLNCGMSYHTYGQTCNLSIKGYILDQHDLSALSYANITLSGTTLGAQADSLGYYEIKGLCKGNYTLICSHIGCEPVKRKNIPGRKCYQL